MVTILLLLAACRAVGPDRGDDIQQVVTVDPIDPSATEGGGRCADPIDADGDGWDARASGGADCDDADATVNPAEDDPEGGADSDCDGDPVEPVCAATRESCNGVDDDCDGLVDDPYVTAVPSTATVAAAGRLLPRDGVALVVGVQGANTGVDGEVDVYDVEGNEVVRILGTGQSATFGSQLATGRDLTGDGVVDLVIAAPYATVGGEPNSGRVWVIPGPLDATTTLADAVFVFEGGELDGQPGGQLAVAPDLTGDGLPELIIGYYRWSLVYSGAPAGTWHVGDATAAWEWNSGGGAWHWATTPDADGDGLPELAVGMDTYGSGAGVVARYDSTTLVGKLYFDDVSASVTGGGLPGIGARLTRVGDTLWTLAAGRLARIDLVAGTVADAGLVADALADGGDLDADGADDLLLADDDGLFLADGARYAAPLTLQTDRGLQPAIDADGDGVPDVVAFTSETALLLTGTAIHESPCNADGDLLSAAEGDCDDTRTDVLPVQGRETCDGLDNDCDGVVDGPSEIQWASRIVAATGIGDLDGDGSDELVLLDATGDATAVDGETMSSRFTVSGGTVTTLHPVGGAGDTDGNGHVELLLSGADESWLLPLGEPGTAESLARVHFRDGTSWRRHGDLGGAGDVNGDGLDDAWVVLKSPTNRMALSVWTTLEPGIPTVDEADTTLVAPETWDLMNVASGLPGQSADLDGDGLDDLLVGNPRSAYGDGRVMGFLSRPAGERPMDDVAELWLYGDPLEGMGNSVALGGDADGDGIVDAILGGVASARLLHGAACPLFLDAPWQVPAVQAALADVDDDGRAEAWLSDPNGTWNGVRGGVIRLGRPGEPAVDWRAGYAGDSLGALLVSVGDTDHEGGADLLYTTAGVAVRVGSRCP